MAKEKMNAAAKNGDKIPLKIVAGPTEQGKAVLHSQKSQRLCLELKKEIGFL